MERQFNLSLREVLTFWEMIFLTQDVGNDGARDLHPALTTFLEVIFRPKEGFGSYYYRPWVIKNALQHRNRESPNYQGSLQVAAFLRECADVLEQELKKDG